MNYHAEEAGLNPKLIYIELMDRIFSSQKMMRNNFLGMNTASCVDLFFMAFHDKIGVWGSF